MRAQGVARQEIARLFRATPARVAMIEQEAASERAQVERCAQLQAEILWPQNCRRGVLHGLLWGR